MLDLTPRSLVEERAIRPPTIGKIRPGIKVLTRKAQENQKAVDLYKTMVAAGDSYETIGKTIESQLKLSNALIPRNVPYFVCRRSDFSNPATADEILKLYGEDRGDGLRLYRFPVMFAFDDWLRNVPNEMAVYTTTSRLFFSQYGPDGKRYCKTYAPVERDARAQRAKRSFGGRLIVHRQDDDIAVYSPLVDNEVQVAIRRVGWNLKVYLVEPDGARRQTGKFDRHRVAV